MRSARNTAYRSRNPNTICGLPVLIDVLSMRWRRWWHYTFSHQNRIQFWQIARSIESPCRSSALHLTGYLIYSLRKIEDEPTGRMFSVLLKVKAEICWVALRKLIADGRAKKNWKAKQNQLKLLSFLFLFIRWCSIQRSNWIGQKAQRRTDVVLFSLLVLANRNE